MIIVPTEKRFDWQNAPLVLFAIVVINVLVFYVYQTGDTDHFEEAVNLYVSDGIYDNEKQLYEDFLVANESLEALNLFREVQAHPQPTYAAFIILQDQAFYEHMLANAAEFFAADYYVYWEYQRQYIHDMMFEVSYQKHGLVAKDIKITSLITHQFLHGGTMHLLGNMFFLIICGFAVEASLGHKKFLLFYLLTGIGAGLAQAVMDLDSDVPLIGASGAVSGVMAMYLGIFRLKKIEFFYWFFVFVGYFRAPALFILPFYIGNELYSMWSMPETNVAFMAHVGGFVTGAILIGLLVWLKPETLNQQYIDEDQAANPEQVSLNQIYQSLEKYQFDKALKQVNQHISDYGPDFNLKVLKYKLLQVTKPEMAAEYFSSLVSTIKPNHQQLAKIEKMWQALSKDERVIDAEAQYKLAWNFITVPDYIDEAIKIFQQMYQADNKHPALNVLAKKIAFAYKRLENRAETDKYMALAQELS
ncbi:rhomboid family intramembrane serine protease [Marinicella sp. S1101]|uniref:rhomboid family intramembrane serine protease n=1 Tax=Marinicella marina TaxID=2996016 RepID=UPI002260A8A9|nr:rhomboid family intramembrane serine protease [Marinicella marina]MCX7554423.1 rhomboid family intramembrane serine protease [Marinicella marina]MDJ1140574.1 rhomboid family intramembrane serine protease [Marinicella marina]